METAPQPPAPVALAFPNRRAVFYAALALDDCRVEEWCYDHGMSKTHLRRVLLDVSERSNKPSQAIVNAYIASQLPAFARITRAATRAARRTSAPSTSQEAV